MNNKFNLLVAERVMEEGPPEGYEKVGDHWEKEEPEFYDDGTYARSWIVHTWPPDYRGNIATTWRVVDLMQGPFAPWLKFLREVRLLGGITSSDEMPKRVSIAALRAVGVPEAEIQEALNE